MGYRVKLVFKKDYGTFDNKIRKGEVLWVDSNSSGTVIMDNIKKAAREQLGCPNATPSREYYTIEK